MNNHLQKDTSDMEKTLSDIKNLLSKVSNLKKTINAFSVFQFLWLVEIYFLGLSNVINYFRNRATFLKSKELRDCIASGITPIMIEYNDIILNYFTAYAKSAFLLGIYLLIAGCFFSCLKYSLLEKYLHIFRYCDYGIYAGQWLILIYASYWLSQRLGLWFIIVPALALSAIHKGVEVLKERYHRH